jgi:tetraacyldisaccharide 4'-kinase
MAGSDWRLALQARWYDGSPVPGWARALEGVYARVLAVRRALYRLGMLRSRDVGVPVVVVGNLTVGGTGKTPLVGALAGELRQRGWRPGIALRGYGGSRRRPGLLPSDADPAEFGDEAVLLARSTHVPVATGRARAAAARLLVDAGCDVVVCDDGLQHWALARDLEVLVVDGQRRFGNGRLLPAGPLREPAERAARVDFVVVNGGGAGPGEYTMRIAGQRALALGGAPGGVRLSDWRGQAVHAVAGIGNPERFFAMLEGEGIVVQRHPLPDHHHFTGRELVFDDALPVLVTEKDAVKCARHAHERVFVVPVEAELPPEFVDRLHAALHAAKDARR